MVDLFVDVLESSGDDSSSAAMMKAEGEADEVDVDSYKIKFVGDEEISRKDAHTSSEIKGNVVQERKKSRRRLDDS